MAAIKSKLGRIPCEGCGHPVLVKENEAGTLTIQCDECDTSAFAKKGTGAAARWRAKLAAAGHLPAPGSVPKADEPGSVPKAPEPAPVPVPKPKAGPFDFLGVGGAR